MVLNNLYTQIDETKIFETLNPPYIRLDFNTTPPQCTVEVKVKVKVEVKVEDEYKVDEKTKIIVVDFDEENRTLEILGNYEGGCQTEWKMYDTKERKILPGFKKASVVYVRNYGNGKKGTTKYVKCADRTSKTGYKTLTSALNKKVS